MLSGEVTVFSVRLETKFIVLQKVQQTLFLNII